MVAKGTPLDEAKQALYDEVLANFNAFLADRPRDSRSATGSARRTCIASG